jgi:cytochrome c biogenesis protein CcmG, thiol:disulfide interchange protein DsbE
MTDTAQGRNGARIAAISVGVVLLLFIALLATRKAVGDEDRFGPNKLVGQAVPAVAGTTLDGGTVDIDRLRGKWVVVNFFATWCTPCRVEHPELLRFREEHAAAGNAEVVSIAFDDTPAKMREFFTERGGTWPVVVGDTGRFAIDFGVTGIPESFVVAPNGQVVAHFNGVTRDELDKVIDSYESAANAATGGTAPGTAVAAR